MFVLAGCQSAFKLPAGCEEDTPVSGAEVAQSIDDYSVDAPISEVNKAETISLKDSAQSKYVPEKTVIEGDTVSFPNLKAVDPDGDKLSYTFSEPLDSAGRWQTKVGDAGEYVVAITASDGKSKASQKVKIVVVAKNRSPVIEPIADVNVNEGDIVRLSPVVSDAEGDKIDVSFSGWMNSDSKKTDFGDAGIHVVTVKASDGTSAVSKKVNVVVQKVNRAPVIEQISDVVIKEGDKMTIKPVASDLDKDKLSFTFSQPLDANGVWQTKIGDVGSYKIKVIVSDGELSAEAPFTVTVQSVNRPPVLIVKAIDMSVDEGDIVTINAEATDADGDSVRTSFSGWMTSDTYKTTFEDSGVHAVTVTATDGINTVTKDVQVTVRNINRAPVFDAGSFD